MYILASVLYLNPQQICTLLKLHRVHHLSNPLNIHHHLVAILQPLRRLHAEPHTTRRARHDQTTRLQRLPRAEKRHQLLHPKAQIRRVSILPQLPVHINLHVQPAAVAQQLGGGDAGPERGVLVEGLGEGPLRHHARLILLHLPVARGDVVAADVAGDKVQRFVLGDVLAVLADDDRQLALVVALRLAQLGDRDRLARVGDCLAGFEEQGGVLGQVEAGFQN